MIRILFSVFSLLAGAYSTGLVAQQNIHATGGEATSSAGTVSFSVGQVGYINTTTVAGTNTEGVQQPYEFYTLEIIETHTALFANAYPNPTTENLMIELSNSDFSNMYFQVLDAQGKLLLEEKITSGLFLVELAEQQTGIYFLKIFDADRIQQTLKIIKN
jgi:hypothetical protein